MTPHRASRNGKQCEVCGQSVEQIAEVVGTPCFAVKTREGEPVRLFLFPDDAYEYATDRGAIHTYDAPHTVTPGWFVGKEEK